MAFTINRRDVQNIAVEQVTEFSNDVRLAVASLSNRITLILDASIRDERQAKAVKALVSNAGVELNAAITADSSQRVRSIFAAPDDQIDAAIMQYRNVIAAEDVKPLA